jgi:stage V sporulation protein G
MEISDIRVKLIEEPNDRLKAVCSITLGEVFVVRDLKVVDGTSGLFVAMPSRKLTAHCPRCRNKNHLRARFCNECGSKLPPPRMSGDSEGRTKLHRDIAHPINTEFRELVQERVIQAFHDELELAKQPGYEPRDLEAGMEEEAEPQEQTMRSPEPERRAHRGARSRRRRSPAAPAAAAIHSALAASSKRKVFG